MGTGGSRSLKPRKIQQTNHLRFQTYSWEQHLSLDEPAEQIKLPHHTFIQYIMKWSCDDLKMTLLITLAGCACPHRLNSIKMAVKWSKAKVWLQQPWNSQSENWVSFLLTQHEVIRTVFIPGVCVWEQRWGVCGSLVQVRIRTNFSFISRKCRQMYESKQEPINLLLLWNPHSVSSSSHSNFSGSVKNKSIFSDVVKSKEITLILPKHWNVRLMSNTDSNICILRQKMNLLVRVLPDALAHKAVWILGSEGGEQRSCR